MLNSYFEGYNAFLDGLDISDNPYIIGMVNYKFWENGWNDARLSCS